MAFDPNKITFFAKTDARGQNIPFGIKAIDRTKHMYIIGKTGMGKSTLLENMAVQDIKNGEGIAFIDPHGQTAETLLDYVPEERKKDVLYFAPFDVEHPVAFNVMEDVGPERRHLVVSGLMSVFKKIWVDAWSARMEYILQNTLLALLEYPDSTLLGVNRMLSDKAYRRKVIDNISDPAVKSFWVDEFLNYNERYMQEAGDAIKNKIGQFTANPLIRNIIGQPKSSFDIRKMMDEKKIIIMNLSKGLVGESNANLLGSMLTTRIYLAAMSRADVSVEQMKSMPNFYFYVDEFQSFANATFADILSEARKYKLNLTIAHQYIEQMEEEVRNAVFGNVGTIISFRVGPFDAEILETLYAPQFTATDIVNLGFAQIYLTLMIDGIGSKPFSAETLPPIEPGSTSCKHMIIAASREQFSQPRAGVEAKIIEWHEIPNQAAKANASNGGNKNSNSNNNRNNTPVAKKDTTQERRSDSNPTNASSEKRNQASENSRVERSSDNGNQKKQNTSSRTNTGSKNEKSIDDLRSVLKKLSAEQGGGSNDSKKESKESRKEKEGKQNDKKPAVSDLKAALSAVVGHSAETTATHTIKKELNLKFEESSTVPATDERAEIQQQADELERLENEIDSRGLKQDDPLDPKKIERMMKVPPSTHNPF